MVSQGETLIFSFPQSDLNSDSKNKNIPAVISPPASIPRNVQTEISYYTPPKDGGPQLPIYMKDEKTRVTKNRDNFQPVTIYDVRGSGVEHTLDKSGIQYIHQQIMTKDFDNDAVIKDSYYPEITNLLYKVTGATKVHIFQHVVRKPRTRYLYLNDNDDSKGELSKEKCRTEEKQTIPAELQRPVRGAHIDQSYSYAPELVKAMFPGPEGECLLRCRFQIINVWRPIKTIYKDPFAVLDARTVLEEELVPIKVVYPKYQFESVQVRHPSEERKYGGHSWYYMSQQTPEEVLAFKIFDSKTDGRARRVPHSSFTDAEFEGCEARQSVEVRALVFHEDDVE